MSGARELMRTHIDTLFTHDARGRIVSVNEPNGKPAPRFFLGRTMDGIEWRVRNDVGDALERELAAVCAEEIAGESFQLPADRSSKYENVLARVAPVERRWSGPAYSFPSELLASDAVEITHKNSDLLRAHLAGWLGDVETCHPMMAVIVDGQAVSLCASVRTTVTAHQAGVETAPEFRGQGYAIRAVTAWANRIRRMGRIALYSTSWENASSQAVARKLGLQAFGGDFHIA